MRLYEIQDPHTDQLLKIWKDIQVQCSSILSFYKDIKSKGHNPYQYFFRGTSGHSHHPVGYKGRSVTDRNPKDTDLALHNKVVAWMKESGALAHRDNSIFVTSDQEQATEYGRPYIIFPFNGFRFTWSRNLKDMYEQLANNNDAKQKILSLDIDSISDVKWFDEFFDFDNTDLEGAFYEEHEVMISGEYYAINSSLVEYVERLVLRGSIE